MDIQIYHQLKERLQSENVAVHTVEISDEELSALTMDQAKELAALYGSSALMLLPSWEREFYEWLRKNDEPVWNDLWQGDDQPYLVSLDHLPDLLPKQRGFLISDLMTHPNAYFDARNIIGEGAAFLDVALDIVRDHGKLEIEQAFVVELWRAPIDQWRFAYMYNVPLNRVKHIVAHLLQEGVLGFPEEEQEEGGEAGVSGGEVSEN